MKKYMRCCAALLSTVISSVSLVGAFLVSVSLANVAQANAQANEECVVLMHGLARTSGAMKPLLAPLESAGYRVVNVDYPSRKKTVEALAPLAVKEMGIDQCGESDQVHFVTHSLGGILVRYYFEHNAFSRLGRVVMIAPPNQGSEVVDNLKNIPGYLTFNGPAGMQLGTDENSIPSQLGAVDFALGVIAGKDTVNPILSQYLPNPDDGKVSVESTKVDGMDDFIVMPHTHTFIMRASGVIEQVVYFLQNGRFNHSVDE